ncbi:MAG: MMPL family transporter [Alphaproteobacteria bacterium]|nr:MMPL family transporter [Alphaproteobacteria bacterium SS10]
MKETIKALDGFAVALAEFVIRWRYLTILACIGLAFGMATFAANLGIANNYRVFFSADNPELTAFEEFQTTYTKNDNILFVIRPKSGESFDNSTLAAVEALTAEAWKIPFAIRVDSITNFQSTRAIEDDLIVEDLVIDGAGLNAQTRAEKQQIALAEPLLRNQLITPSVDATAVNVVLQFPEKDLTEVPSAVNAARELRAEIASQFSDLEIKLTGVAVLNNAFSEAGLGDMSSLVPLMYLVVLLASIVALRSLSAVFATLMVITLSVMFAMGAAGLMHIDMTPISFSAPTVIMTLAVADSIHIMMSMRSNMRRGMAKREALVDAIRINFLAVSITSLTTIVGFLALNFSDAPPFWHLGNITASGIFAAWLFSITLLPALVSLLPMKVKVADQDGRDPVMRRFADWVIERHRSLAVICILVVTGLIAMIPTITFNDQWVEYFDERVEFRRDTDQAVKHFGVYPIEFSIPAGAPGGISEPDFLNRLEAFTIWLREQPNVTHVYSLSDIFKRLNMNMHADDQSYFRTPQDRELSAQYLLLYELSLPYGLDLNDRVNIDKSATRVTVTFGNITTAETKEFLAAANTYIAENFPPEQQAKPTSAQVMFTYITDRNVQQMILGTTIAILAISVIMMFSLQSFSLGLLSLIPNGLPILVTFGIWALLVNTVGFSVATVASISLGIIVDDTVHFLTKYQRARREKALEPPDAIRYAFETVGSALIVNTIVLALGFSVLAYSSFKMNVDMGLMTIIAIVVALILDFLLLPALLLFGHGRGEKTSDKAVDTASKPVDDTAAQPA